MALVLADRVRETSTATGTGAFTLAGTISGYRTFSTAIGNGNTTHYTIVDDVGGWEVGLGTVGAGSLTRDTVLSSTNANALVNFAAGSKDVFVTQPAGRNVWVDGAVIQASNSAILGVANGGTGGSSAGVSGQVLTSNGTTFAPATIIIPAGATIYTALNFGGF